MTSDAIFSAFLKLMELICSQFYEVILFLTAFAVLVFIPRLIRRIINV